MLLRVRAVIAESFGRIHRSDLIDLSGVLPLQYQEEPKMQKPSDFTVRNPLRLPDSIVGAAGSVKVIVTSDDGKRTPPTDFEVRLRINFKELDYYQHGGILQYVLRQLATT